MMLKLAVCCLSLSLCLSCVHGATDARSSKLLPRSLVRTLPSSPSGHGGSGIGGGSVNPKVTVAVVEATRNDYKMVPAKVDGVARKASEAEAQILVMSEFGIALVETTPRMPNIGELVCDTEDPHPYWEEHTVGLYELACAAKKNNIHIVANIAVVEQKPMSTSRGRSSHPTLRTRPILRRYRIDRYNTNVVFDKKGKFQLRYDKINLFNDGGITPGPKNQTPVFTLTVTDENDQTEKDLTFGTAVCFDSLHSKPWVKMMSHDPYAILVSAHWVNMAPLLVAPSVAMAVSEAYQKPVAFAGGEGIKLHTGSGIFTNGAVNKYSHAMGLTDSDLGVDEFRMVVAQFYGDEVDPATIEAPVTQTALLDIGKIGIVRGIQSLASRAHEGIKQLGRRAATRIINALGLVRTQMEAIGINIVPPGDDFSDPDAPCVVTTDSPGHNVYKVYGDTDNLNLGTPLYTQFCGLMLPCFDAAGVQCSWMRGAARHNDHFNTITIEATIDQADPQGKVFPLILTADEELLPHNQWTFTEVDAVRRQYKLELQNLGGIAVQAVLIAGFGHQRSIPPVAPSHGGASPSHGGASPSLGGSPPSLGGSGGSRSRLSAEEQYLAEMRKNLQGILEGEWSEEANPSFRGASKQNERTSPKSVSSGKPRSK